MKLIQDELTCCPDNPTGALAAAAAAVFYEMIMMTETIRDEIATQEK